jgi:hypothetical protein
MGSERVPCGVFMQQVSSKNSHHCSHISFAQRSNVCCQDVMVVLMCQQSGG